MTKTYMLAARIGGDHVRISTSSSVTITRSMSSSTSFLLCSKVASASPLRTLWQKSSMESATPASSIRWRDCSLKLPLLRSQSLLPLFEILAAPLVLRQRDDLPEVGLGQPLQLAPEGAPPPRRFSWRAFNSCGSHWPPCARRSASVMDSGWVKTSHRSFQTISSSCSAGA